MPKYVKSRKGEMQRKKFKGFDSLAHMTQFLSRCDKKTWKEYRKLAKAYLTGKKTPPRVLRKAVLRKILRNSPQRLVGHVEREHRYHRRKPKNSKLGGGISEAVSTISHEVANLLGVPYLQARLFGMVGVGLNFAFRGYWNGINLSVIYLRTLVLMHTCNIFLNYVLIFGAWGFPEMGATGAGVGTAIATYLGSHEAYRHGRVKYNAELFGLSADAIREEFSDYIKRFNV